MQAVPAPEGLHGHGLVLAHRLPGLEADVLRRRVRRRQDALHLRLGSLEQFPAGAQTCHFPLWKGTDEDRAKWEAYTRELEQKALIRIKKRPPAAP